MNIYLANPRGFCAGVDRAIAIVKRAIEIFGAPVYVRHEVVHNTFVVNDLKNRGAVFVDELDQIPDGHIVIFSAHGVSQRIKQQAQARKLHIFDATCPLVTKVHMEVKAVSIRGEDCILIGHQGHPEVEGTLGQFDSSCKGNIYLIETLADAENITVAQPDRLNYVTQTTLSVDDTATIIRKLKRHFPQIKGPKKDDICYATQNRQDAVKKLAQHCSLILIVGSVNSSNSNRLQELAQRYKIAAYLIDKADDIKPEWLRDKKDIGVTAGASAPEILVQEVIKTLESYGGRLITPDTSSDEDIVFSLPKELQAEFNQVNMQRT